MSLREQLWLVWSRLRNNWATYLQSAGLDLSGATQDTLVDLLLTPIQVNFRLRGLEEFSREGRRGIEPGAPARSLLYHVLASPQVTPPGIHPEDYPTFGDIEIVENAIFAAAHCSVPDLRAKAGDRPLAIAIFAYEYVPAIDTVHRRHSDLCFSRTAICRIGNALPHFVSRSRGFLPYSDSTHDVHVIPSRCGAFVAALTNGDRHTIGPERFARGDEKRTFWVPIHKLFAGSECLADRDIDLAIESHHVNEKIRRVHLALQNEGVSTGWSAADLDGFPFRITEDLARFDYSEGLLTPIHHPLIEPARTADGCLVGFPVPPNHDQDNAILWFKNVFDAHPWPEFVHAKHAIVNGDLVYLPHRTDKSIVETVREGGYIAANFVDYTADGWLRARCSALCMDIPDSLPAYSILAQPDFFPLVKQSDLMEWWDNSAPKEIKANIWADTNLPPSPLSGERLPANFSLARAGFDSTDTTMAAIIGMDVPRGQQCSIAAFNSRRESALSYRATNLFGPGWDISEDCTRDANSTSGAFHMANYGLGSPFSVDTMICAASGALWAGAAPDITRMFAPSVYPTVTPFLDDDLGWDQLPSPYEHGQCIDYTDFAYADYVKLILENNLRFGRFAGTTVEDYIARTLTLARVYEVLGAASREDRARFAILNFRLAIEVETLAVRRCHLNFDGRCAYYLRLAHVGCPGKRNPDHLGVITVVADSFEYFIASPSMVAHWESAANEWEVKYF